MWTVAQVAARGVDTQAIDTVHRVCTFIDVCAVASTPVQFIAIITGTTEHPRQVLAGPKDTDILESAFINILAGLAVLCGIEAHFALAAITPRCIETLSVLTQVHIVRTFIHICAGEAIPIEAFSAGTAVGPWCVDAVGVQVALVLFSCTLIQVIALQPISKPACATLALEAPRHIDAGGMHVAVVSPNLTFINVCAACGSLLDEVAQLAVADEGALCVFTLAVQADVRVEITFIHVNTSLHVQGCHEAIEAEAAILPRDVSTLPTITDVWIILTFVNICTRSLVWHQCIAFTAAALIAALRVGTVRVTATVGYGALINVDTALSVWCGLEARITSTLVGTDDIDTASIATQVVTEGALIDIYTNVPFRSQLVSRRADTFKAAICVHADPASAQQWVLLTLVDIHAVLHHHEAALVAFKALTLEAARRVDTGTMATQVW